VEDLLKKKVMQAY